jgi:hypothetical protein
MFNNRLYKYSQEITNEDVSDKVIEKPKDYSLIIPKFAKLLKEYIQENPISGLTILDKLAEKDYEYVFNIPMIRNLVVENNIDINDVNFLSFFPMLEYVLSSALLSSKKFLINKTVEIFKRLIDSGIWTLDTALEVLKNEDTFREFLLRREYNELQSFLLQPELIKQSLLSIRQRLQYYYPIDKIKLTKDNFIKSYLKETNLGNLKENTNFTNKLNQIWDYSKQDPEFINKLNYYKNIELSGERINVSEILKYLRNYKPFSLLTGGPGGRGAFWFYENIDKTERGSPEEIEYQEALKYYFNVKNGVILKDERYDSMLDKVKSFRTLDTRLSNVGKWWNKRRNNPTDYDMRIGELLELYFKIKKDFNYLSPGEINNLFNFTDDIKLKKIFDKNYKYNDREKFELLLENYISGDIEKRSEILSKNSADKFIKLVKSKYPDLLELLEKNKYTISELEQLDLSDILKRISNSLFNKSDNEIASKHFQEFKLPNSSNDERKIFEDLEKLGLYAIPAKQAGNISLVDDEGQKFGFRIDFLLPCNVREYDGENYTLRNDIVFVGEYFGYYGSDYEMKKQRKIQWQNNLESSLDQRCLHIEPGSDLCSVLSEKNIDSKCYPDFGGKLFNVNNDNDKKTFYVKSQMQHFLYQYLVNELLWEINYDYNLNTLDNFNKVKESNGVFLDRFENLLLDVEKSSPQYLVVECAKIVDNYKKSFERKRMRRNRQKRLSFVYNHRKNPSN